MSTPNKRLRSKQRNMDRFNARASQVRYKEASLQRSLKRMLMAPLMLLYALFHRDKPTPKLISHRLGKKRNGPCPCGSHKNVTRPVDAKRFRDFEGKPVMETVSVPVKFKNCHWASDNAVVA